MEEKLQIEILDLLEKPDFDNVIEKLKMWTISSKAGSLDQCYLWKQTLDESEKIKQEGYYLVEKGLRTQNSIRNSIKDFITTLNEKDNSKSNLSREMILFLGANPIDTPQMAIRDEFIVFFNVISNSKAMSLNVKTDLAINSVDLSNIIVENRPRIIHFSGHGARGAGQNTSESTRQIGDIEMENGIVLKDKNTGMAKLVTGEALSELFSICKKLFDLQIVFLNACYTEEQALNISKNGIYVVGHSEAITDESAIIFSKSFYENYVNPFLNIEDAFSLAKNVLSLEGRKDAHLPILCFNGVKIEKI
jgi:hypothetical protein